MKKANKKKLTLDATSIKQLTAASGAAIGRTTPCTTAPSDYTCQQTCDCTKDRQCA